MYNPDQATWGAEKIPFPAFFVWTWQHFFSEWPLGYVITFSTPWFLFHLNLTR